MACEFVIFGCDTEFPHRVELSSQAVRKDALAWVAAAQDLTGQCTTTLEVTTPDPVSKIPSFLGPKRKMGLRTIWFTDANSAFATRMRWG